LIILKRLKEIDLMREAGRLVAQAHRLVREMVAPGVTTGEIDKVVADLFEKHGATPLFLGVKGGQGVPPFPAVCCISVNEQVVHGIPGNRKLQVGDIVKVDTGCRLNGWCGDSAWSYAVGEIDPLKKRLMQIGEANLMVAIRELATAKRWSDVARSMEKHVHQAGFSIVENFVGHGIGREMHEEPQVPNFCGKDMAKHDFRIGPGIVLAIEPMVNAGGKDVRVLNDKWTVETRDRKPSVHFEHTVAITETGPRILTTLED
jgi:methionyl aminopeptidase